MGDLAGATDRLEEALAMDRTDGDPRGESAALHYLGVIGGQRGQVETAAICWIKLPASEPGSA